MCCFAPRVLQSIPASLPFHHIISPEQSGCELLESHSCYIICISIRRYEELSLNLNEIFFTLEELQKIIKLIFVIREEDNLIQVSYLILAVMCCALRNAFTERNVSRERSRIKSQ